MIKKLFGFTLSEVLITLTIIGAVSAIAIPTLLNSTDDTKYAVALKKKYAEFAQAYQKNSV